MMGPDTGNQSIASARELGDLRPGAAPWPVERLAWNGCSSECQTHVRAPSNEAAGRAVAWVDDEFGPDAEEWAASRGCTMLVRTELDEGLTEDQAGRLLEWAHRQSAP